MTVRRVPIVLCIIISAVVAVMGIIAFIFDSGHGFTLTVVGFAVGCNYLWFLSGWVFNIVATIIDRKDDNRILIITSWLLYLTVVFIVFCMVSLIDG